MAKGRRPPDRARKSQTVASRRRLILVAAISGTVAAIALIVAARATVRRAVVDVPVVPDRNVLLVTIDTLRADALGSDGGPARTPNIDTLAAAGIRFTFAHAHSVVTLPS